MRNLMVGAGMVELEGYKEESSTDLCMQYDRIEDFGNCNKFWYIEISTSKKT